MPSDSVGTSAQHHPANPFNLVLVVLAPIIIGILIVLTTYHFDLILLSPWGGFCVLAVIVGTCLILWLGILGSHESRWGKLGQDLSIIAFGGALSTLTLQLAEETHNSLLPGLVTSPRVTSFLQTFNIDPYTFTVWILGGSLSYTLIASVLTTIMESQRSKSNNKSWTWTLAGFNSLLGAVAFFIFITLTAGSFK